MAGACLGSVLMRSHSLARVVTGFLGVSLVMTVGCADSPTAPRHFSPALFVHISPNEGPAGGATAVTLSGAGFQSGATVTIDGNRVDATVLNANTISVVMPAHAAGKVDVAVIRAPGQQPLEVQSGYRFIGPPIISQILPDTGSTSGGAPILIRGDGFWDGGVNVTMGGIKTLIEDLDNDYLYLSTPAHAAGTVEVIVTDRFGQNAKGLFTYASPGTFDFNGDWRGWAEDASRGISRPLTLTVRDNVVVGVSCGGAPSLALDPAPVVANGEFSFSGGGTSISGKILSPIYASGSINTASCGSLPWSAEKK